MPDDAKGLAGDLQSHCHGVRFLHPVLVFKGRYYWVYVVAWCRNHEYLLT